MSLQSIVLPNRLTVVHAPLPGYQSATVAAFVRVGARHETEAQSGIAHLIEHLAFKGTLTRTAMDIARDVEDIGAMINAFTSQDMTAYYVRGLGDHLPVYVDILADVLQRSTFPVAELDTERDVVLQEIAAACDDPSDVAYDALASVAWPGQAYGRPVLGNPDFVRAVTADTLQSHMARHYVGANMVIVGVGNVGADFLHLVEDQFGDLPAGTPSVTPAARYVGGCAVREMPVQQSQISLAFPSVGEADARAPAFDLMVRAFGGGMSSPLFQEVREKRGLAYDISCGTHASADAGVVLVEGTTDPAHAGELLEVVAEQMNAFAAAPGIGDVNRAQNTARAEMLTLQERPFQIAIAAVEDLWTHGRTESPLEKLARIEEVTLDEVAGAMRSLLDASPSIGIAGPKLSIDPMSTLLDTGLAA